MQGSSPILFALNSSHQFGQRVAESLGLSLSPHEERDFEDGEHKIRPLVSVRNRHVLVIQSLYAESGQSVNDKLCRLLFMAGAVRDASASRVTIIAPYLCYARKDRKTKPRDPVTTRYVAGLFESVGVDQFVTMDVHNLAAFQNAFHRTRTDHLEAMKLFINHFCTAASSGRWAVVSPDVGGIKRAELFRQALARRTGQEIETGFMQKQRSGGVVTTGALVGNVEGRSVIMIDDLISSGTTLANAAAACRAAGATHIEAAATHGIFTGDAENILSRSDLDRIVVTDTVPPQRLSQDFVNRKLTVLSTADCFAEAIRCIDQGGSIVELMEV